MKRQSRDYRPTHSVCFRSGPEGKFLKECGVGWENEHSLVLRIDSWPLHFDGELVVLARRPDYRYRAGSEFYDAPATPAPTKQEYEP